MFLTNFAEFIYIEIIWNKMGSSIKASKENNKENESAKSNPIIENIKSRYILSKITKKEKTWNC